MITPVRTELVPFISSQAGSIAEEFHEAKKEFSSLIHARILKMCPGDIGRYVCACNSCPLYGLIKFCSKDWKTFFTYPNLRGHIEEMVLLLGEAWKDSLSYRLLLDEEPGRMERAVREDLVEKRANLRLGEEEPDLCFINDFEMGKIEAACTQAALQTKSIPLCRALLNHQQFNQDAFKWQLKSLNPFSLSLYEKFDCLPYRLEEFILDEFDHGTLAVVLETSEFIRDQFLNFFSEQPHLFLSSFSRLIKETTRSQLLCEFLIRNFPERYVEVIFKYIDESMQGDAGFKKYASNHAAILRHLLEDGVAFFTPDLRGSVLDAIGREITRFSIESKLRGRWSCIFQEPILTIFALRALIQVAWGLKDGELKDLAATKIGDSILSLIARGGNAILPGGPFWEAVFSPFNSQALPSHLKLTQEQSEELERLLMKKAYDENLSPQSRLKFHIAAKIYGKDETISTDGSAAIFEKLWESSKDRSYLCDILLKAPYEYFAEFFKKRREVFPALYNIGAGMLRGSFFSQSQ